MKRIQGSVLVDKHQLNFSDHRSQFVNVSDRIRREVFEFILSDAWH